jgi:hypothetical protein
MSKYLKWAGLFLLVLITGTLVEVYLLKQKEEVGISYSNLGQEHIAVGAAHSAYNSNPPTSGPHYVQPAKWGVYRYELPDEQLVHNLEHGGIWISYNQMVASGTIEKIETLAAQYPDKIIVEPRAKDDSPIMLVSWTRLLSLTEFDENTILNFIKLNKNRSPEPNAQ